MLDNLKERLKSNKNFMKERWDGPLHSQYATDQQGKMWPSSEDFYHPLNPMYSLFLMKQTDLEYFKVVLLRDGAFLILDFFYRFPIPKDKAPIILVPADLSFLVPRAWKPKVLFYRLIDNRHHQMTNELVFLALASDCFFSWQIFKPKMNEWLQRFPKNASVSCYFSIRPDPIDPDHSQEKKITFEFLTKFQNHFNQELTLINGQELKAKLVKPENTFINFDLYQSANYLCTMETVAKSQGAQVLERPKYTGFKGERLDIVPVTFNVNIEILNGSAEHCDFDELYFLKKTLTPTGASLVYPIVPKLMEILDKRFNIF